MSSAELERAKAAAVSSVLMNLESRAVVAEDIGRQVLTYGHRWVAGHWGSILRGWAAQCAGGQHSQHNVGSTMCELAKEVPGTPSATRPDRRHSCTLCLPRLAGSRWASL